MTIRSLLIGLLFATGVADATAQELNCQVDINTQKLQNVSSQTFETLKAAITEYMSP